MLFDLRAPGRKRMIQGIYLLLAVVLVGGMVLFGVGTGLPGILDSNNNTGGGVDLAKQQRDQIAKIEKRVAQNPKDAEALAKLASLRYAAGVADFPENATTAPASAKAEFEKASTAWHRYLKLDPEPIDQAVANRMASAYSPQGLNRPDDWADVQGIIVQAAEATARKHHTKVPAATYIQLLTAQYAAKRTRPAKITAEKARQSASPSQKKQVDAAIAYAKDPNSPKAQAAVQQAGGGGTGKTITLPDKATK